jgi:hypothetical protein
MASCIIQIHTAPRDAIIVCALRTIQPHFAAPVNPDIYLCTLGWVGGWFWNGHYLFRGSFKLSVGRYTLYISGN